MSAPPLQCFGLRQGRTLVDELDVLQNPGSKSKVSTFIPPTLLLTPLLTASQVPVESLSKSVCSQTQLEADVELVLAVVEPASGNKLDYEMVGFESFPLTFQDVLVVTELAAGVVEADGKFSFLASVAIFGGNAADGAG